MAKLSSRRPIMLAAMVAFALLLVFSLVTALAAPAANAVTSARDLVIKSITIDPQTKVATVRGAVTCTGARALRCS